MGHSTDLVDRLTDAAVECKTLLREIHSAQKALHKDARDAQKLVKMMEGALERLATRATEQAMTEAIEAQIINSTEQVMRILDKRADAVYKRFDDLVSMLDTFVIEGERVDLETVVTYFQKEKADKLREALG